MMLEVFKVRGFKNFRQWVVFEYLDATNVIHGPNNVGKSNALEAMELFFRLLGLEQDGWIPIAVDRRITDEEWAALRFTQAEVFNLESPEPIEMIAEIKTNGQELSRAGIRPLFPSDRVGIELVLQWFGSYAACRVRGFKFADGTDAAAAQQSPERKSYVLKYAKFLAQNFLIRRENAERFALISAHRAHDETLLLSLYDAKESSDIEEVRRWERFVETMRAFEDILGPGAFVTTYDRRAGRANLFYQTAHARLPLHLLGSGVQQIIALIGHLLMTNATLVAIEEPEINLRYSLQQRLREILTQLVGAAGGPTQLFLTSHSPAFESSTHFYLMTPTAHGPTIERRDAAQAFAVVDFPTAQELPTAGNKASSCYLSTEGVMQVPARVMNLLGLPSGGGVVFVDGPNRVEMMSNATFAADLGLGEDTSGDSGN